MLTSVFLRTTSITVMAITLVLFCLPTPSESDAPLTHRAIMIKDVRVFNGNTFIERANVVIADGVIKAIGDDPATGDMQIIDGQGKTLIPGLIDAHTHNFGNALKEAVQFGVTTNIDMFTSVDVVRAAQSNEREEVPALQTDLISAGMLATAPGGHGTQFGLAVETLTSPADAQVWVDQRLAEGSDFIKLVYMPGNTFFSSLDRATAAAVIKAAHARQRLAVAHVSTLSDARDMLDEGIDGLVHIFADSPVTPAFLDQARAQGLFVIPTLAVTAAAAGKRIGAELLADERIDPYLTPAQKQQLSSGFGDGDWSEFDFTLALANTRAMHEAGIPILAGSDAPNPGTAYGASLHQELAFLVEAGLTPTEALLAATLTPATAFKLPLKGRIEVGAAADLILLNGNPNLDITATRAIKALYKDGRRVTRNMQADAIAGSPIARAELSQFQTDLSGPSNLVWSTTNDTMAGGTSATSIQRQDGTLKISADVNRGFAFPWSGAALFGEQPLDISAYTHIEFAIRGTPGSYQVMSFSGEQAGAPPSQKIEVAPQWQTIRLALSDFRGLDQQRLNGIAIVAGPAFGRFEYFIRDVKLERS